MKEFNNVIVQTLQQNGILVGDDSVNDLKQMNTYILKLDSLQFISFICDLEEQFQIEIPEELLYENNIENFLQNLKSYIG